MRCLTTNLWMPHEGKRDSLGAWLLHLNETSAENNRHRLLLFCFFGLPILTLFLGALSLLFTDQFWLITVAAFFGVLTLLSHLVYQKFSLQKWRTSFFDGLIDADFLVLIFLIAITIENAKALTPANHWIYLGTFVISWMFFRLWEAKRWKNILTARFRREEFFWNRPLEIASLQKRLVFGLGVLVILSAYLLSSQDHPLSKIILALIPLALPLSFWMTNRLLAEADQYDFFSSNWKGFLNLRKIKSLILHQHGVMTEPIHEISEIWIDDPDQFQTEEVEEALALISDIGTHPIAEQLRRKNKKKSRLLRLLSFQEKSHLGISAELEDLNRDRIVAHFGTLSWQKILKHEISESGMQSIRNWRLKRYSFSLLSLNRSVVAAVAWSSSSKASAIDALAQLKEMRVHSTLISSQIYRLDNWESPSGVKDSAVDLLPAERPAHLERWFEREVQAAIVRCCWDQPDPLPIPQIVISRTTQILQSHALAFHRFEPISLVWLLKIAKSYFHGIIAVSLICIGVSLAVFLSPHWITPTLLAFSLGIVSMLFFTRLIRASHLDSKN